MKRQICVVTGSRAEYGLLSGIIDGIQVSETLELQIVVTGMHLSERFGCTWRDIEYDGYRIDRRVKMSLTMDTSVAITKDMGHAMIDFADVLEELKPDMLLILGDRFEIFVAAVAAMMARIPIAHVHGGEATEGSIDEAIRHSITKMSHLHFVAATEYAQRIIQLGEAVERVHVVGGMGVDNIRRCRFLERNELEGALQFSLGRKNLLVTFHPVTLEKGTAEGQMKELLAALETLSDIHIIFTLPNADPEGEVLVRLIKRFVSHHPRTIAVTSMGQRRYFSCLGQVDGVVGNSSSGLLEAPSFKIGTINIGDRQRGRLKAKSVIDCSPTKKSILQAIKILYSPTFQSDLKTVTNPYDFGGGSAAVVQVLENADLDSLLKKTFVDCPKPNGHHIEG